MTNQESVLIVKENEYMIMGSQETVNSTSWATSNWHLDKIGKAALSNNTNSTLTGKGVDVYILDSGIHYEHEEFGGRALYPGCDPIDKLYDQNQSGRDCDGHGTHVAGLVGGNSTGVANGVTLFSVRILNCVLEATEASLTHGIMCVVNHRQNKNETYAVINLSIAGTQTSLAINKSLELALDNNIIVIAAAGNGNDFKSVSYDSCKAYPAGYPGVINVGATDIHDNALMGEFDGEIQITNMGKCVDVFAPGYKVLSSDICPLEPYNSSNGENNIGMKTYNNTCKKFRTGTSQSTSIVAGAVSLLLEKCPLLPSKQIKTILQSFLSISNVKFCKPFEYLREATSVLDVITTIIDTPERLLHIGNLSSINFCNTTFN